MKAFPPAIAPLLVTTIGSSLSSGSVTHPSIWLLSNILSKNLDDLIDPHLHFMSVILERAVASLLKSYAPPLNPLSYPASSEWLPLKSPMTSTQGTLDTFTSVSLTWQQHLTPTMSPKLWPYGPAHMGVCTVAFLVVNILFGTFCTVEHFFWVSWTKLETRVCV